jgi:predicted small secreted protein
VQGRRMMIILSILLLASALLLAACGAREVGRDPADTADSTRLGDSMKGYELYSWQDGEVWYFSLVVGTNRLKTPDEISSSEVRLEGLEALERELDKLPGGERVFWSAQRVQNTTLPPDEIIGAVRAYCRGRGILLVIEQVEATRPDRPLQLAWMASTWPWTRMAAFGQVAEPGWGREG